MKKAVLLVTILLLTLNSFAYAEYAETASSIYPRKLNSSEVYASREIASAIKIGAKYIGGGIALAGLFIGAGIFVRYKSKRN